MIDDNYEICKKLGNADVKTLYFHSLGKYNIDEDSNIVEVYNWGEVYRNIKKLAINK